MSCRARHVTWIDSQIPSHRALSIPAAGGDLYHAIKRYSVLTPSRKRLTGSCQLPPRLAPSCSTGLRFRTEPSFPVLIAYPRRVVIFLSLNVEYAFPAVDRNIPLDVARTVKRLFRDKDISTSPE